MIPNGVDIEIFVPAKEQQRQSIRDELGLPPEKPVFLFVGRFVEKKGLPILQQLAQRFQSVHWAFAGWGSLDPSLWELPNVTVFRDRRGIQLTPIYQSADLLVLPSKGEGFPLVVQEAMACGTPVMVGSETAQACSAAKYLMFSEDVEGENTVEQWSRKIENLLQDSSLLTPLRPKIGEFAQQHWHWQRCADRYHQIFQKLTD
jgi:glycosyltransferase involved in cell wall biosynthesis